MKKFKKLLVGLAPIVCVACSAQASQVPSPENQTHKMKKQEIHNDYSVFYQGESEHWKADLVMAASNGTEEEHFELTYNGKDAKTAGNIHYSISLPNGKLSGDAALHPNGVLDSHGNAKASKVPAKNEAVNAVVEWNKEKEIVHLHLNNSK